MQRLAALATCAFLALSGATARADTNKPADTPLALMPYTPGLDPSAMNRDANPCTDFYEYACGGWVRRNPIPEDQSRWDVYRKLHADSQRFQWGILTDLAKPDDAHTPLQRKLGDYFAACMDERRVASQGIRPIEPALARIAAFNDRRNLPALLAELQRDTPDANLFFGFGSAQDFSDATRVIAILDAGGLGLPDRDYYINNDKRSKILRTRYAEHIARTFVLLGDDEAHAREQAAIVLAMETELAWATLSRVEQRDPYKLFHKMNAAALAKLTQDFNWQPFLAAYGLQTLDTFNVTEPAFFKRFDLLAARATLADIRNYLRWQVAHSNSPYLAPAMVDEHFAFFSKTLRGVPKQQPRWKRCVTLTDRQLGEALGQEYVARAFSPEMKAATRHMTTQIEAAMARDLDGLNWMSPATKRHAKEKLAAIANKIGYPDQWRNYDALAISRDDFAGNVARAQRFETERQLGKIGKPVDRGEWGMTPPTINAYYDPQLNDINFPAGILQPPLYDPKMDDAPNYGNTGGTIGHELTHAFDDEGRQFDGRGNLKNWWTQRDAAAFKERAQCLVKQYAKYVVIDDIRINSQLTLGEDIADLGGLILAWSAWKAETANKTLEARDGLTPEQRFFVGNAQWACNSVRPEDARILARTDPHSPGKYRVNGLVSNMPAFAKAFSCKAGDAMVNRRICRIW